MGARRQCASLSFGHDGPALVALSGRRPLRFLAKGPWLNNVDVTHALQSLPVSHFNLRQRADGTVILRLAGEAMQWATAAHAALTPIFGDDMVQIEELLAKDKTMQYTSDLPGADV